MLRRSYFDAPFIHKHKTCPAPATPATQLVDNVYIPDLRCLHPSLHPGDTQFSRKIFRQWPLYENYSMTNSAQWPLHGNYSMTNFTQWPLDGNYSMTNFAQWPLHETTAGCRLGVGLGVGTAGLQRATYQRDKSRVSRVQDMFCYIRARYIKGDRL